MATLLGVTLDDLHVSLSLGGHPKHLISIMKRLLVAIVQNTVAVEKLWKKSNSACYWLTKEMHNCPS